MPSSTPSSQTAVTGRLAQRYRATRPRAEQADCSFRSRKGYRARSIGHFVATYRALARRDPCAALENSSRGYRQIHPGRPNPVCSRACLGFCVPPGRITAITTSLDGNKCREVVAAVFRRRKRIERTRRSVVSRLCGRRIQKRSLPRSCPRDGLDDGTLALDRGKRAAVEIVDVTPDLQFPIVVDKRALIGQVHPDLRGLQLNILLRPAEHLLDLLDRPVLAGTRDIEENLGIFRRILHTHAAVAVGPNLVRKHELLIRIMLIHQESVGEVETKSPERT